MNQGNGQGGLLLHAGGEIRHLHLCKLPNAEGVKQLLFPPLPDLRRNMVELGEKVKQIVGREKLLQLQLTGEKTHPLADLLRLPGDTAAIDEGIPPVRLDQGGQNPQRRGFTCAIGSQEAKNLPLLNGEGQIPDRNLGPGSGLLQLLLLGRKAEGLLQALCPQYLRHGTFLLSC